MRILVIDNYDSFVYNLVQYLGELGEDCTVWRNDAGQLGTSDGDLVGALESFDAVLVSPGPGDPTSAGRTLEVIAHCAAHRVPLLGVCLGHQALGEVF
ncbi:MAG: anthranilate synthase component II, partial [Corynebacterium sp.]|nr:anthranilate synthase component II [Corynebacterium sp.]